MAAQRRDQQKLWLILFRIKAIRGRFNSLAAQYFAFSTLAVIVVGAALIITVALLLGPLSFLMVAALVALLALLTVSYITRQTLHSIASPIRAASLADQRAGLKGRLLTVLLSAEAPRRSALWPYLVEDTYGRREDFEPARIEPRWLSRSLLTLLGACLVAFLLIRFAVLRSGAPGMAMSASPGEVSADIGNLDIRPADPALQPNAEIYADPATLQKLAQKLAAAQTNGNDNGSLSRWMNKARSFAGQLQNEITGNRQHGPAMHLRLTDREPDSSPPPAARGDSGSQAQNNQGSSANSSQAGGAGGAGQLPPQESLPARQADQLAQNGAGLQTQPGLAPGQQPPGEAGSSMAQGGGGASHGAGSDPQNLFGPPSSQPFGSDSFKITIDARPSDESSTSGAPAYIPPKVRVPLNQNQYPDEPIARASVPAGDQVAVKRVFER